MKPTSDTQPAVTVNGPGPVLLDLGLQVAPRLDISQIRHWYGGPDRADRPPHAADRVRPPEMK